MGTMSASDAAPLPRLGEVFFDVRGNSRSMRLSWYADTGVAVLSIWQGGMCTGTFRLAIADLPRMVETLQRGPGGQQPRWDAEMPGQAADVPMTATAQVHPMAPPGHLPPDPQAPRDHPRAEQGDYLTGAREYPSGSQEYRTGLQEYAPESQEYAPGSQEYRSGSREYAARPADQPAGPPDYLADPPRSPSGRPDYLADPPAYRPGPPDYLAETPSAPRTGSAQYQTVPPEYQTGSHDYLTGPPPAPRTAPPPPDPLTGPPPDPLTGPRPDPLTDPLPDPLTGPPPERRARPRERRAPSAPDYLTGPPPDPLSGPVDRRTGPPAYRADPPERRTGPPDYQSGSHDYLTGPPAGYGESGYGDARYPDGSGESYPGPGSTARYPQDTGSHGRYQDELANEPYLGSTGPMDYPGEPSMPHYDPGTSAPGHGDALDRSTADYPAHYGAAVTGDMSDEPALESPPHGRRRASRGPANRHSDADSRYN